MGEVGMGMWIRLILLGKEREMFFIRRGFFLI